MIAEVVLETAVGVFFALSGYHKLFNAQRRAALAETLHDDLPRLGLPDWCHRFMMLWLPSWELGAGAVATFAAVWHVIGLGLVAKFAMVPCLAIMGVALYCEGAQRVASYEPIDTADVIDDWLYLPETLLGLMALAALLV